MGGTGTITVGGTGAITVGGTGAITAGGGRGRRSGYWKNYRTHYLRVVQHGCLVHQLHAVHLLDHVTFQLQDSQIIHGLPTALSHCQLVVVTRLQHNGMGETTPD